MIFPLISFSQNDYSELTNLQKNIVRITVNMNKDSIFFIDNLWYKDRMYSRPWEDTKFISFKDDDYQMDLYFKDNKLILAGIYYDNKKIEKPTIEFIDKNLIRVKDACNKYSWIFFNMQEVYIMRTVFDKKNKRIMFDLIQAKQ